MQDPDTQSPSGSSTKSDITSSLTATKAMAKSLGILLPDVSPDDAMESQSDLKAEKGNSDREQLSAKQKQQREAMTQALQRYEAVKAKLVLPEDQLQLQFFQEKIDLLKQQITALRPLESQVETLQKVLDKHQDRIAKADEAIMVWNSIREHSSQTLLEVGSKIAKLNVQIAVRDQDVKAPIQTPEATHASEAEALLRTLVHAAAQRNGQQLQESLEAAQLMLSLKAAQTPVRDSLQEPDFPTMLPQAPPSWSPIAPPPQVAVKQPSPQTQEAATGSVNSPVAGLASNRARSLSPPRNHGTPRQHEAVAFGPARRLRSNPSEPYESFESPRPGIGQGQASPGLVSPRPASHFSASPGSATSHMGGTSLSIQQQAELGVISEEDANIFAKADSVLDDLVAADIQQRQQIVDDEEPSL